MPGTETFAIYQRRIIDFDAGTDALERDAAIAGLRALETEALSCADLSDHERRSLLFTLSSVMINLASDARDIDGLVSGIEWATRLMLDDEAPAILVPQAAYNRANGLLELFQIEESASHESPIPISSPSYRLDHLDGLQEPRVLFRLVGHDPSAPAEVRGRALCNLGNVLDESGRWTEAYAAYSDALRVDPSNGNAAGNLAELLRRRLAGRVDQRGHLAAVYDRYVTLAKSLRDRTVELAGVATADRWDGLEATGSLGHVSHAGDQLDAYQQWIVERRLALVATVEGLGSDSPQWDTASASGTVPTADGSVPGIFAALNVLKAEFLVARRLAFRGQQMHAEAVGYQHPDDSGLYTDTLDGAFYGEASASLLLAQRSALDVLDKIAVAANEHFGTDLAPSRVEYAKYWRDPTSGQIRPPLARDNAGLRSLLALAELAADLTDKGMYPDARLLRNAGTHRLVHATEDEPTGPTRDTFSTVTTDDLQSATLEALWVVRVAYLYFVDLIDSQPADTQDEERIYPLPNQK